MNKRDIDYIDAYLELTQDNDQNDMAKTRCKFKPEEIKELGRSNNYWEDVRLKAWSDKYVKSKRKHVGDAFEYLI